MSEQCAVGNEEGEVRKDSSGGTHSVGRVGEHCFTQWEFSLLKDFAMFLLLVKYFKMYTHNELRGHIEVLMLKCKQLMKNIKASSKISSK